MDRKISILIGMFLVALTAVGVGAVTNIFYDTEVRGYLNMSNVTQYMIVTNLTSCDTIDTDSSGRLSCGTDSGAGAAGEPHWVDGGAYLYPNTSYADNVAVQGYLNSTDWSNASKALNSTGILWANYSLYSTWTNLLSVPAQITGNYTNLSYYSFWTNMLSVPAHITGNYTNLAYSLPSGNISNFSYYSDYNNLLNVPSRFSGNYTNLSFYSYWTNLLSVPAHITGNYTNLSYYSFWTNLLSVPSHIANNYTDLAYKLPAGNISNMSYYSDYNNLLNVPSRFAGNYSNLSYYSYWTNLLNVPSHISGNYSNLSFYSYWANLLSVPAHITGNYTNQSFYLGSYDSSRFVLRDTWTTHDSYPAACAAGSAVTTIGDTSTCSAFQTGSEESNTTENMQDAVGGGYSNYSVGVDVQYDDTNNQLSATFDCSEVTDSAGDHLGCSSEDITVDDDFLLNAGDSSTGNITFTDGKGIKGTSGGSNYYNGSCWLIQGSTATIEIC